METLRNREDRPIPSLLVALLLLVFSGMCAAQEKIKVSVTLPYLASVCKAVGGDLVQVTTLAKPGEDPHAISVTPSMIRKVKDSRLFIENGMELEGWSGRLLEAAGNQYLFPGKGGHVYAMEGIIALEKPTHETLMSAAHVHAAGNPHSWLDPINLKVVARNIEKGLAKSLFKSKDQFAKNRAAFEKAIDEAVFGKQLVRWLGGQTLEKLHRTNDLIRFLEAKSYKGKKLIESAGGLLARARKLKNKKIISYHKTWSYFEAGLGIKVVATLESKPGIPPTPSHLASLKKLIAKERPAVVVTPPYYPKSRIEGFASQIGLPLVVLPTQPREAGAPDDIFKMFDLIMSRLEGAQR